MDSGLNHPELYLRGVIPPKDVQNTKKTRIEDLHTTLMKNLISNTFHSMELISRSQALHKKAGQDDAYIKNLQSCVKDLEGEKAELEKEVEAADSKVKAAEETAATNERKLNVACKAVASKDEELVQRVAELGQIKAELAQSKDEITQSYASLDAANKEINELKAINFSLKRELHEKSATLLDMQQVMDEADSKANKDLEAQFNDFVKQMEDARNEYFLDGWEAAMQKMGVAITSETYKGVPFPNPDCLIPKFSFEREAQTPNVDELAEQLLVEEEAEASSAKTVDPSKDKKKD